MAEYQSYRIQREGFVYVSIAGSSSIYIHSSTINDIWKIVLSGFLGVLLYVRYRKELYCTGLGFEFKMLVLLCHLSRPSKERAIIRQ